jgi:Transposase IS66 family
MGAENRLRFIEHVVGMKCATEAGLALTKRIEKNKDKLFTFLDYDGVPWNNNNAEHAVRAFTRLRNVMSTSTPKGTREFATLLSIQQTLRYRGMSVLEFVRSDKIDISDAGDRTGECGYLSYPLSSSTFSDPSESFIARN